MSDIEEFETAGEPSATSVLNGSFSEDGEIDCSVDVKEEEEEEVVPEVDKVLIDPPHNCIYIGKIPLDFDEEDVAKHFEQFGYIQFLSLAPFRRKSAAATAASAAGSTCFAHLSFRDKSAVIKCLSQPHHVILGVRVDVEMAKSVPKSLDKKRSKPRYFSPSSSSSSLFSAGPAGPGGPPNHRKVFIGGLKYTTTSETLKTYFSRWGWIDEAVVMTDRSHGKSRGFGFVTYKSPGAVDACQNGRPHVVDGQRVDTKRAVSREEMEREGYGGLTTSRLFVGELPHQVEEQDLRAYFEQFGGVKAVELMRDRVTGRKRGFAYIEFGDYDVVDRIVSSGPHRIFKRKINVEKALEPGAASLQKRTSTKRKRSVLSSSSLTHDDTTAAAAGAAAAANMSAMYAKLLEQQQAAAAAMAYCSQFMAGIQQQSSFVPSPFNEGECVYFYDFNPQWKSCQQWPQIIMVMNDLVDFQ